MGPDSGNFGVIGLTGRGNGTGIRNERNGWDGGHSRQTYSPEVGERGPAEVAAAPQPAGAAPTAAMSISRVL